MKGMKFFKILLILSFSAMVITKDDDNNKKDPGTKGKEEDKKIDIKEYYEEAFGKTIQDPEGNKPAA